MSFYSLLRAKLRDPEVMAGYLASRSRRRKAIVESANVTIPHAAEVSDVVARLWHLGMAEDAERRRRRYLYEWSRWIVEDKQRSRNANRLRAYFRSVAKKHKKAAKKVTR